MSTILTFGRTIAKIQPRVALLCLETSIQRPLRLTRIPQDRADMAKAFSAAANDHPVIPAVELQHEPEVPSAAVLSKLNIFDLFHAESGIRETGYQTTRNQLRRTQEAPKQQKLSLPPKKSDSGIVTEALGRENSWEDEPGQEHPERRNHSLVEEGGEPKD